MTARAMLCFCGLVWLIAPASAQNSINPRNMYERLICVVPMVGSGTYEDPRRPMFAPSDADRQRTRSEEQIVGYSYQLSDDGQVALVEFVARDRKAFEAIAGSGRSDVKTFRKGKARRQDVEQEFGRHKRNVDWNQFWSKFGVNAR